jgi:hypothetical protein
MCRIFVLKAGLCIVLIYNCVWIFFFFFFTKNVQQDYERVTPEICVNTPVDFQFLSAFHGSYTPSTNFSRLKYHKFRKIRFNVSRGLSCILTDVTHRILETFNLERDNIENNVYNSRIISTRITIREVTIQYFPTWPPPKSDTCYKRWGTCQFTTASARKNRWAGSFIYTRICDCLLFYFVFAQHNEMPLAETSYPNFGEKTRDKILPRIVGINIRFHLIILHKVSH